jgi:hypothetical protein
MYFFHGDCVRGPYLYTTRQTDHALLSLSTEVGCTRSEKLQAQTEGAQARQHPVETYLPIDAVTDTPYRVLLHKQLVRASIRPNNHSSQCCCYSGGPHIGASPASGGHHLVHRALRASLCVLHDQTRNRQNTLHDRYNSLVTERRSCCRSNPLFPRPFISSSPPIDHGVITTPRRTLLTGAGISSKMQRRPYFA